MIFVTVGTTPFNSLIESIDKSGLQEDFVLQTAEAEYVPKNYKHITFTDEVDKYFSDAEIIITHGGAGTLFRLLALNKKIIAVANEERSDKHQSDIIKKLQAEGHLIWCSNPNDMGSCIESARAFKPKKYTPPVTTIAESIADFIDKT